MIIEVKNPMTAEEGGLPLFPDAFVKVNVRGDEVEGVIKIPTKAVENGRAVYTLSAENKLERRDVTIAWQSSTDSYVSGGLEEGDQIIVSPLANPVDGMELQIRNDKTEQPSDSEAASEDSEDSE